MTNLSKDLNRAVIQGLIDDLNSLLVSKDLGSSKELNRDLLQLLVDLTELLTHELSSGMTKEQSQMLSQSVHKDIALTLSKSAHKDIAQTISKRLLKEGSLSSQIREKSPGLSKSPSRKIRQRSPKSQSIEIQQHSLKSPSREIRQRSPKSESSEMQQISPKSQGTSKSSSREIRQVSPKIQGKVQSVFPKTKSREIRQDSPKSQDKESRQRSPTSLTTELVKQSLPKIPIKDQQSSLKRQGKETSQDLLKGPRKESTPAPSKSVHKSEMQELPKKDIMHKAKSQISTQDSKKHLKPRSPTKETPIPKDIIQLVQKLASLNKALSEKDKGQVHEISGDINKALMTGLPELTKRIIQDLTDLCNPVVKGIPKNAKIGLINDLLTNTKKALSEGLSKDENKKVVQKLLSDLNNTINQAVKEEERTKSSKKDLSKDISKEPSPGLSSKALPSRSQDMSKKRLQDPEKETSGKSVSKKKSLKGKDSRSFVDEDKTHKSEKLGSATKSLVEKRKFKEPRMKLHLKEKQRLPFEDEDDAYKREKRHEKRGSKSLTGKTSKESKVKLPSKGKENLGPESDKTKKEGKLKSPSAKIKVTKQLSEGVLLRMLKANKEKADKYKAYKERQLARQKEMERRRLKELSMRMRPVKKKESPPPPPEKYSDSVIDCNMPQCHIPKSKLMVKGDLLAPFDPHYKHVFEQNRPVEPLHFKTQFEFEDGDDVIKKKRKESINYEEIFKDGVLRYQLSNTEFIDNGFTKLPTEKIMRRMNIYRMEPANPQYDWFKRHKDKKQLFYDNGVRLADIDGDGRGRWYYRNGAVALDYYNAKESNVGQRYVVYSSGEEMDNGKLQPRTILALFDVLGNGVVYDHRGNIRLKYNQSEGVLVDPKLGPPGRWKWHTLNDPPVLQQVFVNTRMKQRDPDLDQVPKPEKTQDAISAERQTDPEMLAIELDNFVKEKATKLLQKYKPFQIRMKAVKLNEHFAVKILDQANIYLLFRDGMTNLKLNLGMVLISNEIIDTDTSDMTDVATPYDRHPARTRSVENIHKILNAVKNSKLQAPSTMTV